MESQELALARVADEYRSHGYEVIVAPRKEQLPEFLRNCGIDLIASKDHENVVVEVTSRRGLKLNKAARYVAGEVNARPGWRFDLVVTDDAAWTDDVSDEAAERTVEQIHSLVDSAERLLAHGEIEASCMIAWSAVEASLRATAKRLSVNLETYAPRSVLNTFVVEGLLSREQYSELRDAMRTRNALGHGLYDPSLDSTTSSFLIDTARQLIELSLTASPP